MNIDVPWRIDGRGRTATTDPDDHLRDLIEQVLFTSPGERVMRPEFGSGLLALVFEPLSEEIAATTQFLVQAGLERHLAHLLEVEQVLVEPQGAALVVTVSYRVLRTTAREVATFRTPAGGV